jgi:branched-chain amino acid transport system ATP-binding protein
MTLLDVIDVHVAYGNIEAVKGVSFHVDAGEVVTLIGSNGAGKTTTLRAISGLHRPRKGQVALEGRRIDGLPAHEIVRLGICQAPEGRRIFPRLTVRENLEMGGYTRKDSTEDDYERVYALFPVLSERARQQAGTLSGGEQQMLAIGRALMARPRVLLLDEPSLGIAPMLVERIYGTLKEINEQGTTIVLVEQNANMALELADRGYVLETGRIVLQDRADALRASPDVRKAYLGEG